MELWQMRYFNQIYYDKSLTKAAKNLYISQQGLSKTIKNMEAEFHIKLFERTSRGIQPTIYGEILFEKSQKMLEEYDEMVDCLNYKLNQKNKTITIGIINMLYTDLLKNIMNKFMEGHPDITLEFYELGYFSCEKHLKDNLVDICLTIKPDNLQNYDYIPVSSYNLIVLANKQNPLSRKSVINITDLKSEKFITLPSDSKIRDIVVHFCLDSGFNPNIIITTYQLDYIIELIELNKGIAILPEYSTIKALKTSNNIAVILLDNSVRKVEAGFITKKHKQKNHIMEAMIDYFLESLNSKRE